MEHIDKDNDNDHTPLPTEYKKRIIGHELTVCWKYLCTVSSYVHTVMIFLNIHSVRRKVLATITRAKLVSTVSICLLTPELCFLWRT